MADPNLINGVLVEHLEGGELLEVELASHSHLGDALCVMNGLELWHRNYSQDTKTVLRSANGVFKDLCGIFEFEHIEGVKGVGGWNADALFDDCSWHRFWPRRFYYEICRVLSLEPKESTWMPRCKLGEWHIGPQIYAQLDGRSAMLLPDYAMKKMLDVASFGNSESVIMLGGPDTKEYMGVERSYAKVPLISSASLLLRCHYLISCDSGMSHLAGFLGVPCYIVNCSAFDAVYAMFGRYKGFKFIDRAYVDGGVVVWTKGLQYDKDKNKEWETGEN